MEQTSKSIALYCLLIYFKNKAYQYINANINQENKTKQVDN